MSGYWTLTPLDRRAPGLQHLVLVALPHRRRDRGGLPGVGSPSEWDRRSTPLVARLRPHRRGGHLVRWVGHPGGHPHGCPFGLGHHSPPGGDPRTAGRAPLRPLGPRTRAPACARFPVEEASTPPSPPGGNWAPSSSGASSSTGSPAACSPWVPSGSRVPSPGFRRSVGTLAVWFLSGVWPGLLSPSPCCGGSRRSSPNPASSARPGGEVASGPASPSARTRTSRLPSGFRGHGPRGRSPLLAAGFVDSVFTPRDEGFRDLLLPVTINFSFFLSVLLAGRTAGSFKRRVEALDLGTRALGSGDLNHRIPDLGGDELGRLGCAFNTMAQDLATSREDLARTTAERARDIKEKEIAWEIQAGVPPGRLPRPSRLHLLRILPPGPHRGGGISTASSLWKAGGSGLFLGDVSGKGIPAALFTRPHERTSWRSSQGTGATPPARWHPSTPTSPPTTPRAPS